jgi:hypothetical protein
MTETYRDADKPAKAYIEWLKEIENDPNVDDQATIARAFCEYAYDHTEEIEAGDFDIANEGEPVEIMVSAPLLSRLPVIGDRFSASVDLTPLLVLCVQFGEVWEQEYPYNQGTIDAAVRVLERWADNPDLHPEQKEEARRLAEMLSNDH